jgi:hypothetical protein
MRKAGFNVSEFQGFKVGGVALTGFNFETLTL